MNARTGKPSEDACFSFSLNACSAQSLSERDEAVAPALQFGDEKVQVAGIELVGALGRCACMEEHEMSLQPLALLLGQNGLVDIVRRAV